MTILYRVLLYKIKAGQKYANAETATAQSSALSARATNTSTSLTGPSARLHSLSLSSSLAFTLSGHDQPPMNEHARLRVSVVVTSTLATGFVIVPAVVEIVFVANLAGGIESAIKVALCHSVWILSADAGHDLDAVLGEYAGRARPHASRQDHGRALLAQPHREYPASMFGWSIEQPFADRAIALVNGVEGECLGATEVITEPSLVQWNGNSHVVSTSVSSNSSAGAGPPSVASLLMAAATAAFPPASAIVDRTG